MEKLKDTGIRISFFMTRPGMIFVNIVVVIFLYSFNNQGLGFFYIIGLVIACFVRYAKTPEGKFFHPVSYYSAESHTIRKAGLFQRDPKKAKPSQHKKLSIENHEKIHDKHELNQINRKFKEIEEGYKKNNE